MTSPIDVEDPVDDEPGDLGNPRPCAFAYFCLPTGYEHADEQWRQQIVQLARAEGRAIERWYIDDPGYRTDGLTAMLTDLPSYDITAIFVPDIKHLVRMYQFGGDYAMVQKMTKHEVEEMLNRQIFVLSDTDAPIVPLDQWQARQAQARRARERAEQAEPGRRWRSWGRRH